MAGKPKLNHGQIHCSPMPRAQFRPHHSRDNSGILTAIGLGSLSDAPHLRYGMRCTRTSQCFTLKTGYCYSLLILGNLEDLMHDCSPHVSQFLRGNCKWSRSVTNHTVPLFGICHVIQLLQMTSLFKDGVLNMPMLVRNMCTCIETTQAMLEYAEQANLAHRTKYQGSCMLMNPCCDSMVQRPSHVLVSVVHACADG